MKIVIDIESDHSDAQMRRQLADLQRRATAGDEDAQLVLENDLVQFYVTDVIGVVDDKYVDLLPYVTLPLEGLG